MSSYTTLVVKGQVKSSVLEIIEIGFAYVSGNTIDVLEPGTEFWTSNLNKMDQYGNFEDTITGLTQATDYNFLSYCKDSICTSYSQEGSMRGRTYGINPLDYPTISVSVFNYFNGNNYPQNNYEIGVSYYINVTGETITSPTGETIFGGGDLYRYNANPLTSPILLTTWPANQLNYVAPSYQYLPVSTNPDDHVLTFKATQLCGLNNNYSVTGSSIATSYYPFLWVLKSQFQGPLYFKLLGNIQNVNYFYKDASVLNSIVGGKLVNGPIIGVSGITSFYMNVRPTDNYLSFGYLDSYNNNFNVYFSINGTTWTSINGYSISRSVSSGTQPQNNVVNFTNPWMVNYTIIQYQFSSFGYNYFYIKFVPK